VAYLDVVNCSEVAFPVGGEISSDVELAISLGFTVEVDSGMSELDIVVGIG